MTLSDLCRVTVRAHRKGRSATADLALPAGEELGEVLPCVVDIVGCRPASGSADVAQRWTLSWPDGSALNESMTLHDNGVRDGDILLLTTADARIRQTVSDDLCHAVIDASEPDHHQLSRRMAAGACLWTAGIGAAVLGWSGNSVGSRAVIAAIVAVAATAASIVVSRAAPAPLPSLTLGLTAAAFAAIAGFLAVPGGPAPPNLFLAAAICAAMSTVLLNVTSGGATCFIGVAAFSTTAALAAAGVALWPAPVATVGAMLAAALSPRWDWPPSCRSS